MVFVLTGSFSLLLLFVVVNDLKSTLLVIQGVEDFIEARVSLLLVQEVHELLQIDAF